MLEAGTYAPTSRGMQSPYIVAVQNEELRKQLASMNAHVMGVTSNPYYDAPTYVLVLVPADANNPIQDGSCVLENMMLAAHAIGLGSCWIHREREMFSTSEGKELMKSWGLPEGLVGIGALHWDIRQKNRHSLSHASRIIIVSLNNKDFIYT